MPCLSQLQGTPDSSLDVSVLRHSSMKPIIKQDQSFVIALNKQNVDAFHRRNRKSLSLHNENNNTFVWFPASNGYHQSVLDDFATLTGFPVLNSSKFSQANSRKKRNMGYNTPHHIGCFMSYEPLAFTSDDTIQLECIECTSKGIMDYGR